MCLPYYESQSLNDASDAQAIDYLLQKEPDTLMQSGAVRMLQQKLDQVQDELTGMALSALVFLERRQGADIFAQCCNFFPRAAAKLAENAELRKSSMESDKKSRKQTTETQDMKEELQTLRLKITKATEDLKQAQATANNAMEEARVAVTSELSQVLRYYASVSDYDHSVAVILTLVQKFAVLGFLS